MLKRIISVFLCLVMVISMLPVQVLASEEDSVLVQENTAAALDPQIAANVYGGAGSYEREPNNNTMNNADHIANGATMQGEVEAIVLIQDGKELVYPDFDWFAFTVPEASKVSLTIKCSLESLTVGIHNASDEDVGYALPFDRGDDGWYSMTLRSGYLGGGTQLDALGTGTYYILLMDSDNEDNAYKIHLNIEPCKHTDITTTSVAETCTEDGYIQHTCKTYSYSRKEKTEDALGHEAGNSTVISPTCTEQGYTMYDCVRCGNIWEDQFVPMLGHTEVIDPAVTATCTATGLTEGKHCSVCDAVLIAQTEVPKGPHTSMTDAYVPPSCTQTGLTAGGHCSVCGEVLGTQEVIPALGHTEMMDAHQDPTCTQTGLTAGSHCSVCGEILSAQEIIPALGHTEIVAEPGVMPTCLETGLTEQIDCSVCGEVLSAQEIIPALGHTAVTDPYLAPKCEENGLTEGSHCDVCGAVLQAQASIPAVGHDVHYVPPREPTCSASGQTISSRCYQCGETLLEYTEIPRLPHTEVVDPAVEATCAAPGKTEGSHCSVCNTVLTAQETIPALEHTVVIDSPAVEATCTETGKTQESHCTVCNTVLETAQKVEPLGHIYVNEVCSTCGHDVSGWTWKLSGTTLTISGTGDMEDFAKPGDVAWKQYRTTITEVIIEEGITSIGSYAFYGCGKLTTVTLTESITSIGDYAFYNCYVLDAFALPETVVSVGNYAFYDCFGLSSMILSDSLTHVGDYAFHRCFEQPSAILPGGLTHVGKNAFAYCNIRINMPFSATGIDKDAFLYSELDIHITDLSDWLSNSDAFREHFLSSSGITVYLNGEMITDLVIPEGTTHIGDAAFLRFDSLTSITLTDSVTSIGDYAFFGCSGLTSITLPDSVTSIGNYAFSRCSGLTSITLPDSVTSIGDYAFFGCSGLTSVTLSDSVTKTGKSAFRNCTALTTVTLPDTLREVSEYAFAGCTSLPYVMLEHVVSIEDYAFYNCTSLGWFSMPRCVRIGDYAFSGCITLLDALFPNSLTSIGKYAFNECSRLNTVSIPASLTSIGSYAFRRCQNLNMIDVDDLSAWIRNCDGYDCNPMSYNSNYKWLCVNWELVEELVIPEGVIRIGKDAFAYCDRITSVTLPDSLTSIGENAFFWCRNLADITLPDSVTDIGDSAFQGCYDLTSISLPSGLNNIGDSAFQGCSSMTKITFNGRAPQSVGKTPFGAMTAAAYYPADYPSWTLSKRQDISENLSWKPYYSELGTCGENLTWAYDDGTRTLTISGTGAMDHYYGVGDAPWSAAQTYIRTVTVEEGVTGIGDHAFHGCKNLVTLSLPDSLTHIGESAFRSCSSLSSLMLPENVTDIGIAAFADNSRLTGIKFLGHAPDIVGENAFYNVTATVRYPVMTPNWADDVQKDYGGRISWIATATVENCVMIDSAELNGHTAVWIDGREYPVQQDGSICHVNLPDRNAKTMILYTYNSDAHDRYPVGMKVWTLFGEDGFYSAIRQEELDNILQYSGCSIRVTGKPGIRMITSIDKTKKSALTTGGLAGYTLLEYGTVVAWASQLDDHNPLTLGQSYVKSNYAYKKGVADPVFAIDETKNLMQYTNVLVGFTNSRCKYDLAMRPYMILADEDGNEITLYGGIVIRSIGYIALQNKDTFDEGISAYQYVWDIIHSVYGDAYDEVNAA